MKPFWKSVLFIAAAALVFNAGCSRKEAVLHVYTWADYIKPELVRQFEKENQCRVVIDTFDSNEVMYAKLKAGGGGYDVITPSSYMVKIMDGQGMLEPLNHSLLPNLKHVDRDYLRSALDPEMHHSVPYMLTTTVIAYLKGRVPDFEATWAMFDRADLKGRMTLLNDMRETVGAGLKYLGYSLNTRNDKELAEARDVILRWKKNIAKFENEQYKTGLASGEFFLVHGYSGDIMQVEESNEDIAYAVPKEGTSLSCDDMVIPKGVRERKLAHRFINFIHDPGVAAENTEFISYLCPNKESYGKLSQEILENPAIFLPPEVGAKCEVIEDLGPDNEKYVKIWDEIKAN